MNMANLTLSEQLRNGNLFAEQCPSREVLTRDQPLGRTDFGVPARWHPSV